MFLKNCKIFFLSLLIISSFLIVSHVVFAVDPKAGLETTANTGFGADMVQRNSDVPTIIGRVVGTVLAFLGIIFFLIILYAGFGWITSMGKEEKITQAKETIIAAVLGLLVVLGAYAATKLIAVIFTEAVPR